MNTSSNPTYKSRHFYQNNTCARCGINGSVKKYNFIFKYSYKAKLCMPCIEALKGSANALEWLENNSNFDARGNYWFNDTVPINNKSNCNQEKAEKCEGSAFSPAKKEEC